MGSPDVIALKNITMKIPPGQRLLICGRTGRYVFSIHSSTAVCFECSALINYFYSGKSTLLLALLHLLDYQNGSIKIDGIDISRVPRSILRQQCFIAVPQDPFVFISASLRFNIDTSEALSDGLITEALEKTHLWLHFASHTTDSHDSLAERRLAMEPQDVLDLPLSSFPVLSTGQLQLFSLARAILRTQFQATTSSPDPLRRKPILLLDEATSSLDLESDSLMQDVIQKEFTEKGHTVFAISHRLSVPSQSSLSNGGAVAWIKDGRLETFGTIEEMTNSEIK